MINGLHSFPNAVQRGEVSFLTVNLMFKKGPVGFSVGFRSGEEGGHVIIPSSTRPLLTGHTVERCPLLSDVDFCFPPVPLLEESSF